MPSLVRPIGAYFQLWKNYCSCCEVLGWSYANGSGGCTRDKVVDLLGICFEDPIMCAMFYCFDFWNQFWLVCWLAFCVWQFLSGFFFVRCHPIAHMMFRVAMSERMRSINYQANKTSTPCRADENLDHKKPVDANICLAWQQLQPLSNHM